MGYFKDENHYVNYINLLYKDKFGRKLGNNEIRLFKTIYRAHKYKNVFSAFNLRPFHECVSWEFRNLEQNTKLLRKFYGSKIQILSEIDLFISDKDVLTGPKCKTLLNYCAKKNWIADKKICARAEILGQDDLSKEAKTVLSKLIKKHGVYFLYDENKGLVYIGKSYDLSSRIITSIRERKGKFFSYMLTKTKIDADILEPYMIGTLKPILNGQFLNDEYPSFELPKPKISKIINID